MPVLRTLKWLILIPIILLALVATFLLGFDANQYKADLAALVKTQTGRELTIQGDVQLSFYPNIALELGQVALGNAAGFKGEDFATAQGVRVKVQLMPLFRQQLRVDEVDVRGLVLNLQRDQGGVTNWADLLPAGGGGQDSAVGQVLARLLGNFMVAGVSVQDAQIRWQDAISGQSLTLAPLDLKTGALRPGKPVDIRLAARLQQNAPAVAMTLDGATTALLADNQQDFKLSNLKLKLQLQNKPSAGETVAVDLSGNVDGNLQAKVLAVNSLVAALAIDSKAQGNVQADVKGTLRAEMDAQQYFMPDLQAQLQLPQLGTAQVSGRMQANLARAETSIAGLRVKADLNNPQWGQVDANLTGDLHWDMDAQTLKLDTMQLQAKTQGGQLPAQTAEVQASGSTRMQLAQQQLGIGGLQLTTNLQGGSIPGGSLQQQGKGELNLNWGNGKGVINLFQTQVKLMGQALDGKLQIRDPQYHLAMEGEFQAATLNYPPFQLQNAKLGVAMANGVVTLTPQGTLFKGGYQGNIQINTQQSPPTLQMTHKTSQLRTEDLFFALTQDKTITGALDLTANLTSVAGDAAAFKQNLNGTVNVDLKNGTIRDSNLAQKTQQVVQLFEKESTNAVGEKEVAFTTLGGQWQVQRGVFHTEGNTLLAPQFQIKGSGDVNIANESLDVRLRIGEKPKPDKPEGLFAPLRIHGAWSKPSYALELDVLLQALAKRELDKEKAKLQAQLEAEKQKQVDALKQKVEAEKAKLEGKLQQELQKQLGTKPADPNAPVPGTEEQLKQKLEDELKKKLKGLF